MTGRPVFDTRQGQEISDLHIVHTDTEVHSAGGKAAGGVKLTNSVPSSAEVKNNGATP